MDELAQNRTFELMTLPVRHKWCGLALGSSPCSDWIDKEENGLKHKGEDGKTRRVVTNRVHGTYRNL